MGLLNTMGINNGFTDFLGSNRHTLIGLGAGMTESRNLRDAAHGATQGIARGFQANSANAIRVAEEDARKKQIAEEQARQNKTLEFLKTRLSAEDFAAVDAGVISPSDAFKALTAPQATGAPFTLSPGQVRYGADGNVIAQVEQPVSQEDSAKILRQQFADEQGLRKEINSSDTAKNYGKVRDAYERVRASALRGANDTTGASDMALVFNYMKMLDPGSTVREGEFRSAAESGGLGPIIQNLVQSITAGKLLTPAQRQEFVATADALYKEQSQNLVNLNEQYTGIAGQYGIDPSRVVTSPELYDPLPANTWTDVGDGVKIRLKG